MRFRRGLSLFSTLVFILFSASAWGQELGQRVRLVERTIGIPGHPSPGINAVSHRYAGTTVVEVIDEDAETGWLEVKDDQGHAAWIVTRYIAEAVPAAPAADELDPILRASCHVIGTWNLEHFKHNASRGFPESTFGGPTFLPRTPLEIAAISQAILSDMDAKLLILTEINGSDSAEGSHSLELEELISYLGPHWAYDIGASGGSQRIAFLYDTRFIRANAITEIEVPLIKIEGKDIFARDPLVGHFTLIDTGQPHNDLLIVGLHLASGQHLTENHDAAMRMLWQELDVLREDGIVLSPDEYDILIGGDLNASMFDSSKEAFFDELEDGGWHALAPLPYPATRLVGHPLEPRSQIDYLLASRLSGDRGGLVGQELEEQAAIVVQEIAGGEWHQYRQTFSDHFPVTTCVRIRSDDD